MPVQKPAKHGRDHSPGGEDPIPGGVAVYEIKVFEDVNDVLTGDGRFIWEIPRDLDASTLIWVEGFVTTTGSGATQVQLRRVGGSDLLSTKLTIDGGEKNSKDSSTPVVIDTAQAELAWGDHLAIDVDAAGSGAKGLGVIVTCTPSAIASSIVKGAKGDPGGVTSWTGAWSGGTTYATNDSVNVGGTSYVARQPSTGIQPGVTSGWETYWQVIAGAQQVTALEVTINGNGYPLDAGVPEKATVHVPFACTIVEATILADVAGSAVVDIWKDTYGNYPPTNADSICSSSPPTLSGALKNTDTALTGWTTTISAGDVLLFALESASGVRRLTVALKVTRN